MAEIEAIRVIVEHNKVCFNCFGELYGNTRYCPDCINSDESGAEIRKRLGIIINGVKQ